MTTEEELEKVKRIGRKMREAQKAYFRYKTQGHLSTAKALERDFDKLVEASKQDASQINLSL